MDEVELDAQSTKEADQALRLIEKIKPILAGNTPPVASAVLADLLAQFLAGHQDPDGEGPHMDELRNQILDRWVTLVKELIPINVAIVRKKHGFDKPKH